MGAQMKQNRLATKFLDHGINSSTTHNIEASLLLNYMYLIEKKPTQLH
jgi:hypothetical protein